MNRIVIAPFKYTIFGFEMAPWLDREQILTELFTFTLSSRFAWVKFDMRISFKHNLPGNHSQGKRIVGLSACCITRE
jgi:hypothetical protein